MKTQLPLFNIFGRTAILLILFSSLPCYKFDDTLDNRNEGPERGEKIGAKIAIIGGGIAGSFTAKYLSRYDTAKNGIDSIVVFDPSPILQQTTVDQEKGNWQGGRVASLTLDDGTVLELGGSAIGKEDRLLSQMMKGGPNILLGNKSKVNGCVLGQIFGIYNGDDSWPFLVTASSANALSSWIPRIVTLQLFWRYNIDLLRIWHAAFHAKKSYRLLYDILESHHPASFFHSIDELWDMVGLLNVARISYDDFLDSLGLGREVQWWRKFIPGQGCLREELLMALNICYSNQINSEMNGISGLANFIFFIGETFSIDGGNQRLISNAFWQAKTQYAAGGSDNNENVSRIRHLQKRITSIISNMTHMELWSEQSNMGNFDIVILAVPLQHSHISFFIKGSHFDEAVLQPMPLHGMVDSDTMDANEHYHKAKPLPPSATNRYIELTTTIVSNATLQASYVGFAKNDVPLFIFFTERGRKIKGITEISCFAENNVCRVSSLQRLSKNTLEGLFGLHHKVEYIKDWGDDSVGAVPTYNGGGEHAVSTPFLLYDGGLGTKGHAEGSALYYANSVEATIASMEASAIGAKSVAKLIAHRLDLISVSSGEGTEEL